MKADGFKKVTTGVIGVSAFQLLLVSLGYGGFTRAKIGELRSHARQVAKSYRAILSENFIIVDSVPHEQIGGQFGPEVIVVNWGKVKHLRDSFLNSRPRDLSEKIIVVMKETFGNDYRLIDAS